MRKFIKNKAAKQTEQQALTEQRPSYKVYRLSPTEWVCCFAVGAVLAAAIVYAMLFSAIAALSAAVPGGIIGLKVGRKKLQQKQRKQIIDQFKTMLDSLNNAFSVGYNCRMAFASACVDLCERHGKNAILSVETAELVNGLENNISPEALLRDMAERCGIEDMTTFAETFGAGMRQGGDSKKIVSDTKNILCEKIDIEEELVTDLTAAKTNLNLLTCICIVLAAICNVAFDSATGVVNLITKTAAIILFGIAYLVGTKITHITF